MLLFARVRAQKIPQIHREKTEEEESMLEMGLILVL